MSEVPQELKDHAEKAKLMLCFGGGPTGVLTSHQAVVFMGSQCPYCLTIERLKNAGVEVEKIDGSIITSVLNQ